MTAPSTVLPLGAAAVLGAAGAATTALLPDRAGLVCAGAEVCLLAFVLWPYLILPAGMVGGELASKALHAETAVADVVAVHTAILAVGCLALLIRRAFLPAAGQPPLGADAGPMRTLVAFLAVATLYGLDVGNSPHTVLVAAYEFAVIPLYFFLALRTVADPRALTKAGTWYVAAVAAMCVASLTAPGRHGGLPSAIALPSLLVGAVRTRGWKRAGLVALVVIAGADVVLAAYRTVWVATALALLVMLWRGSPRLRFGVVALAAGTTVLLALAVAVSPALHARAAVIGSELHTGSGYRVPEARVGLQVFASHPLLGAGIGQVTDPVYLPTFKVTPVGPAYHVFYVMTLANIGLLGLLFMARPVLRAVRAGLAARDDRAMAFTALTCGFLVAVCFAGPTDGHWELGLLPAVTLLLARGAGGSERTPLTVRGRLP